MFCSSWTPFVLLLCIFSGLTYSEASDLEEESTLDTNASISLARVQNATRTRELLVHSLFDTENYDKRTYPSNLTVRVGFTLMNFQFLEQIDVLRANVWFQYIWHDVRLRWNPKDFDGTESLSIDRNLLWLPDIYLFNSVDSSQGLSCFDTRLVLDSSGKISDISPCTASVFCTENHAKNHDDDSMGNSTTTTGEEVEERKCHFKMGSWTLDGNAMDVQLHAEEEPIVEMSSFKDMDQNWALADSNSNSTTGFRNANYYACCPEPYVDINFQFVIKKKSEKITMKNKISV